MDDEDKKISMQILI